jgi:hypothetical protein
MDKDKDLYDIQNDVYSIEWQRTTSIENKAACILGFLGILVVYSANLLFSNLTKISHSHFIAFIFYICILSLGFTFFESIITLFYGSPAILSEQYMMAEYISRNILLLPTICTKLNKIIVYNNGLNDDKNWLLQQFPF